VIAERDRLHRMALRAHAQLLELQSRRGAVDDAIVTAQRSLRIDILQEPIHRALMRLYMQSGDLLNAIQQFETCAKVLRRELRVEPDAETKALHREIMQLRERSSAKGASAEDARKNVLVVEDNVLNRELISALLKTARLQRADREGRRRGADGDRRSRVDLMLLDVDLPFIDGHSLLLAVARTASRFRRSSSRDCPAKRSK